jgi:hypothetical protein
VIRITFSLMLFLSLGSAQSSSNNTLMTNTSVTSNSSSTTGPYGTVTVDPRGLATPWYFSVVGLAFTLGQGLFNIFFLRAGYKSILSKILAAWLMTRNAFLGISALASVLAPPPYPLLSDQTIPLAFLDLQAFVKAAEGKNYVILVGIVLSSLLCYVPNVWLGELHLTNGIRCMYHYIPSDLCFVPTADGKQCGIFSTNTSCPADTPDYYFCSDGERWKGYFGIIGAAIGLLVAFAGVVDLFKAVFMSERFKAYNYPGRSFGLVNVTFLVGVVCGVASILMGYFACANPASIEIADCKNLPKATGFSTPGCQCEYMNSTVSETGYFDVWRQELGHDINWLSIAVLS